MQLPHCCYQFFFSNRSQKNIPYLFGRQAFEVFCCDSILFHCVCVTIATALCNKCVTNDGNIQLVSTNTAAKIPTGIIVHRLYSPFVIPSEEGEEKTIEKILLKNPAKTKISIISTILITR